MFSSGSPLHERVSSALTNSRLVKGIQQASPLDQTSCLEGFHSVLNHFAPKMIAYSYVGQYCRLVILLCLTPDNFAHQGESAATQWVNLILYLIIPTTILYNRQVKLCYF